MNNIQDFYSKYPKTEEARNYQFTQGLVESVVNDVFDYHSEQLKSAQEEINSLTKQNETLIQTNNQIKDWLMKIPTQLGDHAITLSMKKRKEKKPLAEENPQFDLEDNHNLLERIEISEDSQPVQSLPPPAVETLKMKLNLPKKNEKVDEKRVETPKKKKSDNKTEETTPKKKLKSSLYDYFEKLSKTEDHTLRNPAEQLKKYQVIGLELDSKKPFLIKHKETDKTDNYTVDFFPRLINNSQKKCNNVMRDFEELVKKISIPPEEDSDESSLEDYAENNPSLMKEKIELIRKHLEIYVGNHQK